MKSDFAELHSRLLDGDELSSEENRRLHQAFKSDPELKQQVVRDEQLNAMLLTLTRSEKADDPFVDNVLNGVKSLSTFPEFPGRLDTTTVSFRLANRRSSRRIVLTASVMAAALIGGVLLFAFVKRSDDHADLPHQQQPGAIAEKSGADDIDSENTVGGSALGQKTVGKRNSLKNRGQRRLAEIVLTRNCRWKGDIFPGTSLSEGSLNLVSGTTKIKFLSGATVELTGPAIYTIRSPSESYLHTGHMMATVPKPATGFTVITPVSVVVDLGTRFEIGVEPEGAVDVKVHQGVVEYRQRNKRDLFGERWRMVAGESHREQPIGDPSSEASSERLVSGVMLINGKRYRYGSRMDFETLMKEKSRTQSEKK